MKKILVSLSILLTGGLSSAFANHDPEPGQQVLDVFKREFAAAQNVTWNKQDEFDKATFLLGDSWVVAYYNTNGELEGCARDILFKQLPLAVMTAVDKRYANADINMVREISNINGTCYSLVVEAKSKKYKIKVDASGNINEVERIKK
jgi:hypothetical protein